MTWNRAMEQVTGVPKAHMIKGNYEYAVPFYGERRPILIDLMLIRDDDFEKNHYAVSTEGAIRFMPRHIPRC